MQTRWRLFALAVVVLLSATGSLAVARHQRHHGSRLAPLDVHTHFSHGAHVSDHDVAEVDRLLDEFIDISDEPTVVTMVNNNASSVTPVGGSSSNAPSSTNTTSTDSPPSPPEFLTCPKDCTGNGFCNPLDGRCVCNDGFGDPDCSAKYCPNGCSGHGACKNGTCTCNPGFFGSACDIQGCPFDCNRRGLCRGSSCNCYDDYMGLYCEDEKGCPQKCYGHGTCSNHTCYCDKGWTGQYCQIEECPNDCGGTRGICDPKFGICKCVDNYYGDACEFIKCPKNCSGFGTCDRNTGACDCFAGYFGKDCDPANCPLDCSGRGTCIPANSTLRTFARCECQLGFAGAGCEREICPSMCHSDSKQGNCTVTGCQCSAEWTGISCQIRQCPNKCTDDAHGLCSTEKWQCICKDGWTGADCSEKTCYNECNLNGVCNNGTCACRDWWTGDYCDIPKCKNDCSGHGQCILPAPPIASPLVRAINDSVTASDLGAILTSKPNLPLPGAKCECESEWGGQDCSVKLCPRNCNNRGWCNAGTCFCRKNYYGIDCGLVEDVEVLKSSVSESQALQACQATCVHGMCIASPSLDFTTVAEAPKYVCACEPMWTGPTCNVSLSTCPASCRDENGICIPNCDVGSDCPKVDGVVCNGHGTCQKGQCKCRDPWHGVDCSIAACKFNCFNHGYCNTHTQQCLCFSGWAGDYCNLKKWN